MAGAECARSGAHDGTTDRTAVPVKNTSAEDFSKFLWVFYDPYVPSTIAWFDDSIRSSTYMYDDAPSSAWRTILSLSSPGKWDFPKIHAFALKRLNNLFVPLVERIVLYKSCSVPFEHLLPLYAELCTREEALSLEESIGLGWELVVPILQVRECLLKWEGKGSITDNTLHNMRAAIEGVSSTWIQDRIKSMFNAVQDVSSLTTTRGHNCPQHHEIKVEFESVSKSLCSPVD